MSATPERVIRGLCHVRKKKKYDSSAEAYADTRELRKELKRTSGKELISEYCEHCGWYHMRGWRN